MFSSAVAAAVPDKAMTCLFCPHKSWQAATAGCPSVAVTKHPANSAAAPAASAAPCSAAPAGSSLAAPCRRAAARQAGRVRMQCSCECLSYMCARTNSFACSRMSLDLEDTHTADTVLPHVEASCSQPHRAPPSHCGMPSRLAYADSDLPGHLKATLQAVAMQQREVSVFAFMTTVHMLSTSIHAVRLTCA